MLKLILPFPPSVNRLWRQWKGRTILSKAGREYRDAVMGAWLAERAQGLGRSPVVVDIWVYVPDLRRRDLDNLQKAALDAMQRAGVFHDDSQIVDLRIRRAGMDRINPRLEITVEAA